MCAGVAAASLLAGAWMLDFRPGADAPTIEAIADGRSVETAEMAAAPVFGGMLVDLRSNLRASAALPKIAALETPADIAKPSSAAALANRRDNQPRMAETFPPGGAAPLPPRRPADLAQARQAQALVRQSANPRSDMQTAQSDGRSLIEKFFGSPSSSTQATGPALAYAAPETTVLGTIRSVTSGAAPGYDRWTAVYDISAHTVYLPNGTRLEAHSGLGPRLDDPRYVHERMRGATPPNVYELTPRERLFHGVQALRLNPIGKQNIFGRAGLLAHTYMLGPKGDSNGCVSFRNYDAFLQAYQRGEIKRLVVVAGLR